MPASNGLSIETVIDIIQVVTEKNEFVSLDETKLMAHFGLFRLSEF